MADLMLGNVDADASDEDIRELLIKYGFPPFDAIKRVPGTGSRPAVLLSFNDVECDALRMLQPRIQNLFWRNRTVSAMIITDRES
ncbi:MAG TPA: RNA-binding protein [Trinickia sp.]|jgi:hypothetical protein|uniref:RNA recognition motif domain-containing protein n=1 Tax=Trinickia sp. TaxID=2571163 RepID=UPI002C62C010|nr:RNA-binding protein [Trinickia sp.]HTI19248.1 RNA-binding protein [Trinickia sp.]